MSSELDGSVYPIAECENGKILKLLGTGTAWSSHAVLTSAHIFKEMIEQNGRTRLPESVVILSGNTALHPSHVDSDKTLDLCCMHFGKTTGGAPQQFVRSAKLKKMQMMAVGFSFNVNGPTRNITSGLRVIHELYSDSSSWLQFGQLAGGLPEGFSGGPVIAETKAGFRIVGILQLGGERAATSRFIAVDLIASFLASQGIQIAIGELPLEDIVKKMDAAAPIHHMEINEVNGSVIVKNGSVGGSIINQPIIPSQPKTAHVWRSVEPFLSRTLRGAQRKQLEQLHSFIESRNHAGAWLLWQDMKKSLPGSGVPQPIIDMLESVLSKGKHK